MMWKSFLITYNIKDNIVFYRQLSVNIAKNNSIVLSSDETSVFVSSDGYIYQIDLDTRKIRQIACFDTSNSQIRSISKDFFISVTRYNYPEMITLFDRKDGKKLDDMSILSFLISHEDLITTFLAGTVKVMRIIVKNNSIVTEQLISSDLDYISSSIFINRNMISVPPYLLNIRTGDRFHIHNTNQIISVDDNKLLVKEGNVYMYYKIEGHQISSEKINLHVSKGFPMDPDKKDIDSIRELVNKNVPLVNANIKKLIGNFIL